MRDTEMVAAMTATPGIMIIVVAAGAVALGFTVWRGMQAMSRMMSGWDALAQRFAPSSAHLAGGEFKAGGYLQGGRFVSFRGNSGFRIQIAREGLTVTASFAPDKPILIPWASIQKVDFVDMGVLASLVVLTVDSERSVQFYLHKDAIAALQKHVPGEHVHRIGSILEVLAARAAQR
jgi:hypothetical protein